MLLSLLFTQPLAFLMWTLAVITALTVHEFSHGLAAKLEGDDTAELSGRLTLNPLAHVDWVGFFMLLLIGFGWGRPVPVDYSNLKHRRFGPAFVSLAGPIANLVLVVIFGLAFSFLMPLLGVSNLLIVFCGFLVMVNAILCIFNLIPIPPLDGSKILFAILPSKFDKFKFWLEQKGPLVLLTIVILDSIFNLGVFNAIFNFFFNLAEKII